MQTAFTDGFLLGLSMIVAIGAQNLFIIRQGILRKHIFSMVMTASVCDAVLILFGVMGLGLMISQIPALKTVLTITGACFLIVYGFLSFRDIFHFAAPLQSISEKGVATNRLKVIFATLGFSVLNPGVWLDTVVLIGGVGATQPVGSQQYFAFGAMFASFLWFFGIGYGAAKLSPVLSSRVGQVSLNLLSGTIMWALASILIWRWWQG
ncbi:LysE/ArgO family amino acid transporter [Algicola sagamiensis]|uniref:LysE/ArgO family amino acid transporter n=1 Tax=Algicola sagamiensis TaxID=163869 RepID=UPI0003655724|nr:LysE family transporter [Algicola sagamiensis]